MISERNGMQKTVKSTNHNVNVEDRKKISITGISNVESFDEETIVLYTDIGMLTIKGENLHINKLNIEDGEVQIDGDIDSLIYSDEDSQRGKKSGIFTHLFK